MNFTIYSLSSLIAWLTTFTCGLIVFLNNPKQAINRHFFLLNLSITVWVSGCFMESTFTSPQLNQWIDLYLYSGAAFAGALYFHSTTTFVKNNWNKTRAFFYGLALFFLGLNWFYRPLLITNVIHKFSFRYIAIPGPLYLGFIVYFIAATNLGLILIYQEINQSNPNKKQQLWYLFSAYLIVAVAALFYILLIFNIYTPPIDNLLVVIYSLIMTYAITKHELLNIKTTITKWLAFTTTTLLFLTGYLVAILWPYTTFVSHQIDPGLILSLTAYTLVIGRFFNPIQNHLQTFSDWMLFQTKVEKETLEKLVVTLHHEINSPLTAISLSAHHLDSMSSLPEPAPHLVNVIRNEIKRISGLLNKLRKLSQIQSKEYVDGIEMIDLEA